MENLDKEELRIIAYNCRKATFLIDKKQLAPITFVEEIELKIHLAGCAVCRIFQLQSITINRMVKELFNAPEKRSMSLNEDFKKSLQMKIENKLNQQ